VSEIKATVGAIVPLRVCPRHRRRPSVVVGAEEWRARSEVEVEGVALNVVTAGPGAPFVLTVLVLLHTSHTASQNGNATSFGAILKEKKGPIEKCKQ
jgi:hypothetical protein